MKRMVMCMMVAAAVLTAGSSLFAEDAKVPGRARPNPEKTSLSGTLGITQGQISLTSGGKTWYVPGLNRFTGFIDGLKEGARVTVEGYALTPTDATKNGFFRVTKLTLNGKDYEIKSLAPPVSKSPRDRNLPGPARPDSGKTPRKGKSKN